jgi:hypothetical protein
MYRMRLRLRHTHPDEYHSPSDHCLPRRGKGWVQTRRLLYMGEEDV